MHTQSVSWHLHRQIWAVPTHKESSINATITQGAVIITGPLCGGSSNSLAFYPCLHDYTTVCYTEEQTESTLIVAANHKIMVMLRKQGSRCFSGEALSRYRGLITLKPHCAALISAALTSAWFELAALWSRVGYTPAATYFWRIAALF